jgi:hypothetical protein
MNVNATLAVLTAVESHIALFEEAPDITNIVAE